MASGANAGNEYQKRIVSIYNKRKDDFPSLKDYNDYLEEVEDMIVNLVEGIDVPAIEARISHYHRENADQIMRLRNTQLLWQQARDNFNQRVLTFCWDPKKGAAMFPRGNMHLQLLGGIAQPRPMGMGPQPIPLGSGNEYEDEETLRLRAEKLLGPVDGVWR